MPSDTIESRRISIKPHGGGAVTDQQEQLPCPRCDSINTKFCYYNNYNFSQPRHFCKTCRRYWTHGGTLRDIPIGGVSRKSSKRSRICTSSSAASTTVGNKSFELQPTPVLFPPSSNAAKGNGLSLSGGFTSLLNHHAAAATVSTNGHGVFIGPDSFGIGLGGSCFDDGRFGQGITVWPFLTGAEATPAPIAATWQFNGQESKAGFMPGEYLAS